MSRVPSSAENSTGMSPAERFAAASARQRESQTELGRFRALFGFEFDEFQVVACQALERGEGVLVAAPTGAGKTVVGEFAVHLALTTGRKAFYTTPIKALSNQKYTDFVARYGAEDVGLLTGDTSINGDAPIVVMTTEVLRNMLYGGSRTLEGLGFVIMDEVHYLADRFRGPVWEEVIIHLADGVQLVSLSATVSNAEEFGDWLEMVRGDTKVVVTEHRPVPLWQHVIVRGERGERSRIFDLYAGHVDPTAPGPNPPIHPELAQVLRRQNEDRGQSEDGWIPSRGRGGQRGSGSRPGHRGHGRGDRRSNVGDGSGSPHGPQRGSGSGGFRGGRSVPRFAVVDLLNADGLLPAIYFIFSRAGCEAALAQCLASGTSLTTAAQEAEIRDIVAERSSSIAAEDLAVLGFNRWRDGLARGFAAHHAGMLPLFKETVEHLFSKGLIKVVFATETLALGINMPARTVVLEKLVKWDGRAHAPITAGEYTQLTGRAGRRGIDVEGHAVVVDHPNLDPVALAGLASRRLYPLRSAFKPTYNMAVNLVEQVGRARARKVLEMSFAQFQADRGVVDLATEAKELAQGLEGYAKAMTCDLGDFSEYQGIRKAISDREKELSRKQVDRRRQEIVDSVRDLGRGDVVSIPGGRRAGYAVVIDPGHDADFAGPRPSILTIDRRIKKLTPGDLNSPVTVATKVRIPKKFNPRQPAARRDLVSSMRNAVEALEDPGKGGGKQSGGSRNRPSTVDDQELTDLRRQMRSHPCHDCPERETHARWANRWRRTNSEHRALLNKIRGRTGSIARLFDRICEVLETLGYLTREVGESRDQLRVTEPGKMLSRVYAENDLLLAECLRQNVWEQLNQASLAAAVSTVVYSARRDDADQDPNLPGGPGSRLAQALDATVRVWSEVEDLEAAHKLDTTAPLDFGLVQPIFHWASGRSLDVVLGGSDLAAGDFVRWCKQVIDVLDQISIVAPNPGVRGSASRAVASLRRGVVAHSGV